MPDVAEKFHNVSSLKVRFSKKCFTYLLIVMLYTRRDVLKLRRHQQHTMGKSYYCRISSLDCIDSILMQALISGNGSRSPIVGSRFVSVAATIIKEKRDIGDAILWPTAIWTATACHLELHFACRRLIKSADVWPKLFHG